MKLVHVTDPHLVADSSGRVKGVDTASALERLLEHARAHVGPARRYLFTGDLAHDELPATYARLRGILGDWVGRARLLPGNHDDPSALAEVFADRYADLARAPAPKLGFAEQVGAWSIIGLDSHMPGRTDGAVGAEQRMWLREHLRASTSRFVAVFIHHPPAPVGSTWIDGMGLEDADDLAEVLRGHSVRALFHGHTHQASDRVWSGIEVIGTPSSAYQFAAHTPTFALDPSPPGYRVIELGEDGTVRSTVVRVAAETA